MQLGLFVLFSSSTLERYLNCIEILVLKLRFLAFLNHVYMLLKLERVLLQKAPKK